MLLLNSSWSEYELIDSGNGRRLERFGKYILSRPDPQAIWKSKLSDSEWDKANAIFLIPEVKSDKGRWIKRTNIPDRWNVSYEGLKVWVKLSSFKHTGVFPEQAEQWRWLMERIRNQESSSKKENQKINILSLFAYTGIATLVCANAGAKVTHLDASKPAISWARENQATSGLSDKPIRWILDDAIKFVSREVRRGVKYDGIIMDPPVYGHGPSGEQWSFYDSFPTLLDLCKKLLSENPLFILVNAYAISASALMLENLLSDFHLPGKVESGELVLKEKDSERFLSTGIFARWAGMQ